MSGRILTPADFDFSDGKCVEVISDSPRFVLPVPALEGGGEPLVGTGGTALVDSDGKRIEGRGLVWIDPDDRCWEAARGDGSMVVLLGPVSDAVAEAITAKVRELAARPADLSLDQLHALIRFGIAQPGVRAAYASTRAYVAAAMVPSEAAASAGFGVYRRRADQVCRAVRVAGVGAFHGPAASPQLYEDGAVVLKHGQSVRLVQTASFEASYRFADGRPARAAELPLQDPLAQA